MKGFLRWLGWLLSVVTVIILANQVPGLQRIDAFTAEYRRPLLAAALILLIVGFIGFMGCVIYWSIKSGETLSSGDEVQTVKGTGHSPGGFFAYRFRGRIWAKGFEDDASIGEMKAARQGWWRDPRWRRNYIMGGFALMMGVGLFSLIAVMAPARVKVVIGAGMIYAAVRLIWAFAHA